MPERMTPERLQEIEDAIRDMRKHILRLSNRDEITIYMGLVGLIVELIAEIKSSWDDIDSLTGEIESIKHQDNDER